MSTKSTRRAFIVRGSVGLLAAAMSISVAGQVLAADVINAQNIAAKIGEAKTSEDHRAIASYYRSLAADAAAKAKEHESMLATYQRAGGKLAVLFPDHCKALIKSYGDAERHYQTLASQHEALAKGNK